MAVLSKRDLESMVCEMRAAGLAHNSISTYVRVLRTFLNWCQREGRANLTIPNMKDKETVKETYTDEELSLLLQKPKSDCSFREYLFCNQYGEMLSENALRLAIAQYNRSRGVRRQVFTWSYIISGDPALRFIT